MLNPTLDFYPSELTRWPCPSHHSVARAVSSAGSKPPEITRGKGKWWCYISWSVLLVSSRDRGWRRAEHAVAQLLCCDIKKTPLFPSWMIFETFVLSMKSWNKIFRGNSSVWYCRIVCWSLRLWSQFVCISHFWGGVWFYETATIKLSTVHVLQFLG